HVVTDFEFGRRLVRRSDDEVAVDVGRGRRCQRWCRQEWWPLRASAATAAAAAAFTARRLRRRRCGLGKARQCVFADGRNDGASGSSARKQRQTTDDAENAHGITLTEARRPQPPGFV